MKIKTVSHPKKWVPFTINITFESEEEANALISICGGIYGPRTCAAYPLHKHLVSIVGADDRS